MSFKHYYRNAATFASFAIAASIPLLFGGCVKTLQEVNAHPIPVKTYQLGFDTNAVSERFPVTLARDRESNISFRVGGVIQALNVREGQIVQSGQSLATLKQTQYISNRSRAEAEVNKLQNAARRNAELLTAGAISKGVREDNEDTLVAAKAALTAAQYDEESATIKAPFTGVVLLRDAELGETVSPGQRIVRIADLNSTVIAKAAVPTRAARQLRVGEVAQIRIDAGEIVIPATIRFVGALSDARTGSVSVELKVQQAAKFASGTLGSVEFSQKPNANQPNNILLPPEALLESKDGVGYVYVLDGANSKARRTLVKVLGFEGEWIRIAGLAKGIKVLTTGAGFVSDGQKVLEIRQ